MELRDFEKAMRRLEEIVQELESGKASLEESLNLFEEGMRLSRELSEVLASAQGKVERLLSEVGTGGGEVRHEQGGGPVEAGSPGSGSGA